MKKVLFAVVAMLAMSSVFAQTDTPEKGKGTHKGRIMPGQFVGKKMTVEERTDKMIKDLNLTDEEAEQVKTLNLNFASIWEDPMEIMRQMPKDAQKCDGNHEGCKEGDKKCDGKHECKEGDKKCDGKHECKEGDKKCDGKHECKEGENHECKHDLANKVANKPAPNPERFKKMKQEAAGNQEMPNRDLMEKLFKEREERTQQYEVELKSIIGDEKFEKYKKSQPKMRRPMGHGPQVKGGAMRMNGYGLNAN